LREKIVRGLDYSGPALFSIFSGAVKGHGRLPPYLVGAAALESRVFPAFSMDPTAGEDWASRFSLEGNPQLEADWPVHRVVYEDANCQRVVEDHPFTLIDFVACDARYDRFFAAVEKSSWGDWLVEAGKVIGSKPRGDIDHIDSVPSLLMVGPDDRLRKVIVIEKIVREARRCLSMWNSLRELGGIHNSHVERRLLLEKTAWEESRQVLLNAAIPTSPESVVAAAPPVDAGTAPADVEVEKTSSDEAYIETPRCASCNECIQLNGNMFAYDGNKQAYIKDITAGTYAQLVEAAENCQVAIIHPGKPRNANEPGLEELLKRAEEFA
jgi:ferredoxin